MDVWLNHGVVPPPTPAGPVKGEWYALMAVFAPPFATRTRMGDHESLDTGEALVEEELKWKWLGLGAWGGKKVTRSLLHHECLLLLFIVLSLPCV